MAVSPADVLPFSYTSGLSLFSSACWRLSHFDNFEERLGVFPSPLPQNGRVDWPEPMSGWGSHIVWPICCKRNRGNALLILISVRVQSTPPPFVCATIFKKKTTNTPFLHFFPPTNQPIRCLGSKKVLLGFFFFFHPHSLILFYPPPQRKSRPYNFIFWDFLPFPAIFQSASSLLVAFSPLRVLLLYIFLPLRSGEVYVLYLVAVNTSLALYSPRLDVLSFLSPFFVFPIDQSCCPDACPRIPLCFSEPSTSLYFGLTLAV